jgi:hypothetical protein
MKTKILLCFLASLLLLSCSSTKDNNLAYFKNLGTAESGMIPTNTDYKITIAPDDELVITVTSSEPEATAIYNLPLDNPARRGNMLSQSSPRQQTYIVDKQGYISFPVLGKLKVEGLTTNEIADLITKDVSKEVKDPFVRVELINFYVNVLGEVKSTATHQCRQAALLSSRRHCRCRRPHRVWRAQQRARHTRGKRSVNVSSPQPWFRQRFLVALLLSETERYSLRRAQQD